MAREFTFIEAMEFARAYAEADLRFRRFDCILQYTLDQLAIPDREFAAHGDLRGLQPARINLGIMAVKELGNDEADFAHALHAIQHEVDHVGRGEKA